MNKQRVQWLSLFAFPFALSGFFLVGNAYLYPLGLWSIIELPWLFPFMPKPETDWILYAGFCYVGLPLALVVYLTVYVLFIANRKWPWDKKLVMASPMGGLWWSAGYMLLAYIGLLNTLVLMMGVQK